MKLSETSIDELNKYQLSWGISVFDYTIIHSMFCLLFTLYLSIFIYTSVVLAQMYNIKVEIYFTFM